MEVYDAMVKNCVKAIDTLSLIALSSGTLVEPSTATEKMVLGIILGLLNVKIDIGVEHDLTALNLDSITASRLASHINDYFRVKISNLNILRLATIRKISRKIDSVMLDGVRTKSPSDFPL